MIFRELTFRNFLVFNGVNRIVFPAPEKHESSLVLILAPNSAGKTSVIRALEFLLYGRLRRDMPAMVDELINKTYIKSVAMNGDLDSWVQAKIDTAGGVRTIRRRIVARRTPTGGNAKVVLEQIVHTAKGDMFKADEGRIERNLRHLVPESLFDYFYFQGETLAQQLIRGTSNDTIPKGLATLLHEDSWKEAIQTVERVGRKISTEIQDLDATNIEYKRKFALRDRVAEDIRKAQTQLKVWKQQETEAQTAFEDAERQIKALGSGQADQAITAELNRKRSQERATEAKFGKLEAEIAALVGASKGLPFYRDAFDPALKQLEQMRRQNILPADVSDGFVSRLLGGTHCLCGRPLTPELEYATERACIEDYRKRTLSADLNSGLMLLLNNLDQNIRQNLYSQIDALRVQTQALLDDRDQTIVQQNDLRDAIKDLEERRANSNVEAIVEQQARQRDASNRRSAAFGKQKQIEIEIKELELREKSVKAELAELARNGAGERALRLNAMRERANELQDLIEKSLDVLKSSFHTILQRSVEKYYNPKSTDNSQAFIDPITLLPTIKRNGKVLHALGGGQRQLLVLAHIISLAELRRDLHTQLDELGILSGRLDDQSFFLDSIFAPCDPAYARDVAAFLPGKARQMVLLLARQQWYQEIQSEIEPHVQKLFVMRLHSNNQDRPADEYVFTFKGKRLNLFTRIPVEEEPYTVIEEIK